MHKAADLPRDAARQSAPARRVVFRKRWLLTAAWFVALAVIIWLADTHRARPIFIWIENHPGTDKFGHFFLIGGFAFFVNWCLGCRTFRLLRRNWLIGGAIVALLATAEEFSQLAFRYRTFDYMDLAANFAGIIAAGWLAKRLVARTPEPTSRSKNEG